MFYTLTKNLKKFIKTLILYRLIRLIKTMHYCFQRMSQSYLYTMNENPALEWNKLGNGSSLDPYFSTSSVLTK